MNFNKKVIKFLVCALMISLVGAVGMTVAAEEVVTGTVEQTDAGLVIMAENGSFIIAGQDLSEMVGKKVKVTGTISEAEAGKTINVMAVEPLEAVEVEKK